jgi:predicted transcriptional regulator
MDTIEINGWQGRLGQGLAPQELRATLYSITKTCKETARELGISPGTVQDRLDSARFKLSRDLERPHYIRTVRELIAEAMKRGIIAPLLVLVFLSTCFSTTDRPNQRPVRTAKVSVMRAYRQEVA